MRLESCKHRSNQRGDETQTVCDADDVLGVVAPLAALHCKGS